MKVRKGFVSNSSSSSFVCDVCGEDVSGWDMTLSEAEMYECGNGHYVCDHHLEDRKDFEDCDIDEKREMLSLYYEGKPEKLKEIVGADEDELYDIWDNDMRYEERYGGLDPKDCPCCNLSKPTSDQLLSYAIYKLGVKPDDLKAQFKNEFATWQEFKDKQYK